MNSPSSIVHRQSSIVDCRSSIVALVTGAMLAFATPALACPVCFGAIDSPQTRAMQAGILALLGVTVAMLGAFGAFFFIYLRRRLRMFEESSEAIQRGAHGGSY